jgi:predicted nucleic acid-binding protein
LRVPSRILVVDAAILVAAVRGRSFAAVIEAASANALITTDRAIEEATRRIVLGLKRPELLDVLEELAAEIEVTPVASLDHALDDAERCLRLAVPGQNGSIGDAHVLALAWEVDGDIWTTDRDFAGTGVASWSTPNLMRALAPQR